MKKFQLLHVALLLAGVLFVQDSRAQDYTPMEFARRGPRPPGQRIHQRQHSPIRPMVRGWRWPVALVFGYTMPTPGPKSLCSPQQEGFFSPLHISFSPGRDHSGQYQQLARQGGGPDAVVGREQRPNSFTPSKAIRIGSIRWRSRRMGAPWPVPVMTARCGCGTWPAANSITPSKAMRGGGWRFHRTGPPWPVTVMTARCGCGR